ncbi:Uncharacterized conserved protein YndB, AHSA1/START domain [Mucilaginibacter lappiensis]|uniref:Activator of Hsp90 ATPase homolog 1-like protein n=1 Tax=Mucilaginibacter lappiensis TaxID=354630 RepID=A0ABR6PF24_9SPHI|nr:SRPBCC domain-containing protein [Mucilaginibacter lappiensis]MBB6108337.1 hypothetical protein [Mucilaginibacter lappiensis]SIQ41770.1 Uncharacterized conserved protein YndB, AHSA1/START domain [Mucilaginibacter lappiensis]
MRDQSYTTVFTVDQSPENVFDAINNVQGWWTENMEGSAQKLSDEFEVRFGDVHYSKQKLIDVIPDKKIVWFVTDSKLNFVKDKSEWTGTQIIFEIAEYGSKTELRFTHVGLTPQYECYRACSSVWCDYINNSLKELITTGIGQPAGKEEMSF